jgi:hypothetical protein
MNMGRAVVVKFCSDLREFTNLYGLTSWHTPDEDSNHFEYKTRIKNPLFSGFCTEIAGPGLEPGTFGL